MYGCDTQTRNYSPPHGPFLKPDLPSFTDFADAASHWLGISREDSRVSQPMVWTRIPDYRGRIEERRLSQGVAHLLVGSATGEVAGLTGKAVADGPEGRLRKDVDLSIGVAYLFAGLRVIGYGCIASGWIRAYTVAWDANDRREFQRLIRKERERVLLQEAKNKSPPGNP